MARKINAEQSDLVQRLVSPFMYCTALDLKNLTNQSLSTAMTTECYAKSPKYAKEDIRPRVRSNVSMDKQIGREKYQQWSIDPHPNRFVKFEQIGKRVRPQTPNFRKTTSRNWNQSQVFQQEYKKNYSQIDKKQGKSILPLGKSPGRKPQHYKYINDLAYDRISYRAVDPKTKSADFSSSSIITSDLPSFMIGIKDRRQFFNITDVSLKLNRFRETDFSPIKSTLKGAKDYESPPKPQPQIKGKFIKVLYNCKTRLEEVDKV